MKAARQENTTSHEFSGSKKRIFSILTMSVPFVLFLLAEIALRVASYGPDLSLFTTEVIAGKVYHIMNPDVKSRYFSRVEFSPNTSPDYFLVPKPAGVFRMFALGGSTTVGYPYSYAGSFSTFLRDRLKRIFPHKKIEVINLGMTATNSFTVVDIARELADYQPDAFLVYDGHNEFYGALGIASYESFGNIRWLSTMYLRLIHVRTFMLTRDIVTTILAFFRSEPTMEPQGTMMERLAGGRYIPYRSEMYDDCLGIFRANLRELVDISAGQHVPVLVASQVSNLSDRPPFVSGEDTFRADLHYQRARQLDSSGRKREAEAEYVKSRDYDQLRFRASSDFNMVIRQVADSKNVFFVDIEEAFRRESPDSLIGNNLILEHLHPSVYGYFLMAKEFAAVLRRNQLVASDDEWRKCDTISDGEHWRERVVTDLDEQCASRRISLLTSGWPFNEQEAYPASGGDTTGISRIAQEIVSGRLTWEQGHAAAAELHQVHGEIQKAKEEYRALMNQLPLNVSPYLRLGQILLRQDAYAEAESLFIESLRVERTAFACRVLGSLALDRGKAAAAIPFLEEAFSLSQDVRDRTESGYLLAVAYQRSGRRPGAIQLLEQLLTVNPHHRPSQDLLRRITSSP